MEDGDVEVVPMYKLEEEIAIFFHCFGGVIGLYIIS